MKNTVIKLTFLILFVLLQASFGQEMPKAYKIDEFGKEPCDPFLARLESFFLEIKNNPSATGYALIYDNGDGKQFRFYESLIYGQMYVSRFDPKRLIVKRVENKSELRFENWIVPDSAAPPPFVEIQNAYRLQSTGKAFMLSTTVYDICPTFSPKLFADYLHGNPDFLGRIVIFNKSIKQARKDGSNFLKTLTQDYQIPGAQVKVVYNNSRLVTESEIELWLIPTKRK